MELVLLPDCAQRPLAFYLAQEEWLASRFPGRDFFFVWQVAPSVIIGRNQLMEKEIDAAYCRDHGIRIFRRRSGGGAVYADGNNLMLSYVTTSASSVSTTFARYTSMVAASLRKLGLDATDNTRNDILIGGRKVSGNSFYHLPGGRSIVHGTMLYDCDPAVMEAVLTPAASKLESHGVASVRSRVTTVREHLPSMSLDEFRAHLMATIPDGPALTLAAGDISEIKQIEQAYYSPGWLEGKNPAGSLHACGRLGSVGEVDVYLTVERGVIGSVSLRGDYLETADASGALDKALCGIPLERETVREALARAGLSDVIPGLTPEALTSHLFD